MIASGQPFNLIECSRLTFSKKHNTIFAFSNFSPILMTKNSPLFGYSRVELLHGFLSHGSLHASSLGQQAM
jgi:hypothetical protein